MSPRSIRRGLAAAALVALSALPSAAAAAPVLSGLNVEAHWLPAWNTSIDPVRELDLARDAHASWTRMSISWNALESSGPRAYERAGSQEQLALARVTQAVDGARARGMKVLLFVDATPAWANGTGAYAVDLPPAPGNHADYAAFVARMSAMFAGRVGAWQIWNEPNLSRFWRTPDAAAYGRLVAAAAPAVRAGDPSALVVSAGLSPDGTDTYAFISQAMAAGMAGRIDRLGLHAYPEGTPETCRTRSDGLPVMKDLCALPALVGRARASQPGVAAWVTEIGWSNYAHPGWGNYADPAGQAAYLTRAEPVLAASGTIDRAFWYGLHDLGTDAGAWGQNLGLVRNDYSPKASYTAYAALNATALPAPPPATTEPTPAPAPVPAPTPTPAPAPNAAPTASFSWTPSSPVAGTAVTFTGAAADSDGSVVAYAWDLDADGWFDDGTARTAARTFTKAGTFRVRWRVTDDRGASTVATRDVTVLSVRKAKRMSLTARASARRSARTTTARRVRHVRIAVPRDHRAKSNAPAGATRRR